MKKKKDDIASLGPLSDEISKFARSRRAPSGPARFIVECGLENRLEFAVNGANTTNDLSRYLSHPEPHPEYRLVSCQFLNGNWILVWEHKESVAVSINAGSGCHCDDRR